MKDELRPFDQLERAATFLYLLHLSLMEKPRAMEYYVLRGQGTRNVDAIHWLLSGDCCGS